MWTRVLTFGALAAIAVAAVTSVLLVLDVVTAPEMREVLAKALLIVGIVTTAILLMIGALKAGARLGQPRAGKPPAA